MRDISKIVNRLVKIYDTRNPFKIAGYENFIVKSTDYEDIKGYYYKVLRRKYIVINQNLDELSRHIVCAHELGHGLLHNISETCFIKEHTLFPVHSVSEIEANKFAAELIIHDNLDFESFYHDGKALSKEVYLKLLELKYGRVF